MLIFIYLLFKITVDEILIFSLTSLFGDTNPLAVDAQTKVNKPTNFNDSIFESILEEVIGLSSSNEVLHDESTIISNFMLLTSYFVQNGGDYNIRLTLVKWVTFPQVQLKEMMGGGLVICRLNSESKSVFKIK